MRKARAVIGANFGDEGKGLIVDYLCATEGAGMVVRFSGGANAGHTVVTPGGRRHVFGHYGSGALVGVPTFLSQFFVCNPLLFFKERDQLMDLGIDPVVYAHPDCLITTHVDMMINQHLEDQRGAARHGSCGVGVNETKMRSTIPELKITMADLWNWSPRLEGKLREICNKYAKWRIGKSFDESEVQEAFVKGCHKFAEHVHPLGIAQCPDPVFEGSQGLLLDQDNKEYFPHVTHSKTGSENVRRLCELAGITDMTFYYVSRTYLTRHGAGPLPGEDRTLRYHDDTNLDHDYQGKLRFAPLDFEALSKRVAADAPEGKIVFTHCDQKFPPYFTWLMSAGPTREHVFDRSHNRLERSA